MTATEGAYDQGNTGIRRVDELLAGLNRIDRFGGIDADGDELLKTCFEQHPAFVSARDMKTYLIRGRKGAGKTAIYLKLRDNLPQDLSSSVGLSFDHYPWDHHKLQAEHGVPVERRFLASWKYLILLSLAKIVLAESRIAFWSEDQKVFDALSAIEGFLVDSYGSSNPSLNLLFSPTVKLKFDAKFGIPGFIEVGPKSVAIDMLPVHFQAVNDAIRDQIFTAMNPLRAYYILFDQLDLGLSTSDPEYHDRIAGLLMASRMLFYDARSRGVQLNPLVFLRDDIFASLHFEDKNKIYEDSRLINWGNSDAAVSLKSLMERRFQELLGSSVGGEEPVVTWSDVFDETERMTGLQTKIAYIEDRTFLRPRDIIKYCNEVLTSAKSQGEVVGPFENDSIKAAKTEYSRYLLDELDDEIRKHVPEYQLYLSVIRSLRTETFTSEDFETRFNEITELADHQPTTALARLFEFSIVGYLRPGGESGGSAYVWRYKSPNQDLEPNVERYRVHPGLKEALGLVQRRA